MTSPLGRMSRSRHTAKTSTGAPLLMCSRPTVPTSITRWSKTAGVGGIGNMRQGIRCLKGWRRKLEKPRKACGSIRHPSRRGSIARRDEGNHSTCQTSCRWTLRRKAVRLLVVRQSWEPLSKTLRPRPQLLPILSSATVRVTFITAQTAPTTVRLHLITE